MQKSIDREDRQLAHSILDLCRKLVSVIHVASKATEKHLGLGAAQLFVLKKLADGQIRSLNELALLTYTHQTSVSVVVKKLVEKKLVSSRQARDDARRLELRITPAGKKIIQGSPEPVQEQLIRAIDALGSVDGIVLERLLKLMLADVQNPEQPAKLFFED